MIFYRYLHDRRRVDDSAIPFTETAGPSGDGLLPDLDAISQLWH